MEEFEFEGVFYIPKPMQDENAKGSSCCEGCAFEDRSFRSACMDSDNVRGCLDFPQIIWIKKE